MSLPPGSRYMEVVGSSPRMGISLSFSELYLWNNLNCILANIEPC